MTKTKTTRKAVPRVKPDAYTVALTKASQEDPLHVLRDLLLDREVREVLDVHLNDLGWHRSWGYEKFQAFTRALDKSLGDDRSHLKRR